MWTMCANGCCANGVSSASGVHNVGCVGGACGGHNVTVRSVRTVCAMCLRMSHVHNVGHVPSLSGISSVRNVGGEIV